MTRRAPALRALVLGAALAAACAPAGAPQPTPEHLIQLREWRFRTAEHVALWYHALAHTGSGAGDARPTLPLHDSSYVRRIAEARRAAGVASSPLEQRAAEFAATFRAATAYRQLEFVPLYFDNADALFEGIRVWDQLGGNPRRASNPQTAAAVTLLSSMFPQPAQRRTLLEWRGLLLEERDAFFQRWWAAQQPALERLAGEAAAEWAPLAPRLRPLLSHLGLLGGDVFLVPALGPVGRLLPHGAGAPRVAVEVPGLSGEPAAGVPGLTPARQIVYAFVHELLYPLAGEAVREHVSPARLRELGSERLELHAAVRAGALVLDQVAPAEAAPYRRYFLHGAGQSAAAGDARTAAEFDRIFALPAELEAGLAEAVRNAMAGI